jgi:galactonate dehydratase
MTVPNFYRLEFNRAALDLHNTLVTSPLDVRGGYLHLSDRPGLGVELNIDYIEAHPDPDWR